MAVGVGAKVFQVVTEFNFEVATAIAKSDMLQNSVGKISGVVEGLQRQLLSIPRLLLSSFSGYITFGSLISGAIGSQQKLQKASLSLANIISANMHTMTGDVSTFNDRMLVSKQILKDVAATAQKFNLDEASLVQSFETIAATLAPKGLAGRNFVVAQDMARGLLKSAPLLGIDPWQTQNQLREIVEGRAGAQNTLFVRLATETTAFKGVTGKGKAGDSMAKMFNALPPASRVDRLRQALLTFASDMDVVRNTSLLLSAQMQGIKNLFFGINSILRPLGEVIVPRLSMALQMLMDVIEKYGRPLMLRFADLLEAAFKDPARVFATLVQIRDLNKDLNKTGDMLANIGIAQLVFWLFRMNKGIGLLGASVAAAGLAGTGGAGAALTVVGGIMATFMASMTAIVVTIWKFTTVLKILRFVTMGIIAPLLLVQTAMSIIRRASAYGTVDLKMQWLGLFKEIAEGPGKKLVQSVMRLIKLVDKLMDWAARSIIAWVTHVKERLALFFASTAGVAALETAASFVDDLTDGIINMFAGLDALGNGIMIFIGSLAHNFNAFAMSIEIIIKSFFIKTTTLFSEGWTGMLETVRNILDRTISIVVNAFSTMAEAIQMLRGGNIKGAWDKVAEFFTKDANFQGVIAPGLADAIAKMMTVGNYEMPEFDNPFASAWQAMDESDRNMREFLKGIMSAPDEREREVSNRTINQNVNINQAFREQQEPDRIARSLVKTLQELADNPRQTNGSRASLKSPFMGAVGGR